MKRTVQIMAVFLGIVIMGLTMLRAVQLENMLPLNSDDVGYINFQYSDLTNQQIDAGLAQIGQRYHVEIYQLSGTVGTREVNIVSRGANQPSEAQNIVWFRSNKQGVLSPVSANPDLSRSGIYALKGSQEARVELEKWLSSVGAVHTWEKFTVFQTYFLPLAYQGVVLILVVAVVLVVSTTFAWFVRRAPSRLVRLNAGFSKSRIVRDDTLILIGIFLPPAFLTLAISLFIFGLVKGRLIWQLVLPVLVLFGLALVLLALGVTFISFFTFPRISDWVQRRSLLSGLSGISSVMCTFAILLSFISIPLVYRALLIASENTHAAEQAMQIPRYYAVSFGGIVDEYRDYEEKVEPFANLVKKLEADGKVAVFKKVILDETDVELYDSGYRNLVIVNRKALQDLRKVAGGCEFRAESEEALGALGVAEVVNNAILTESTTPKLNYYVCAGDSETIAVENQGIFSLANNPLIVVVPKIGEAVDADVITSWATNGAVLFSNPESVVKSSAEFGLNLSVDSTVDLISVYAEDQLLGYCVSLVSLVTLLLTMLLTVVTSAKIYASSKVRKLFPRYITGESIEKLIRGRIILDAGFIVLGVFLSVFLAIVFEMNIPLLFIAIVGVLMIVAEVIIRCTVMGQSLVNVCRRRN